MNIEIGTTDKFDPEVQAMLLAMYSRSYAPIASRLPDTAESAQAHKEKLGKFYVNWGHKSVGQLGATTVWLEGLSQLAAKAVEYHPLFNGQESSTRYIDYSNQPMYTPSVTSVPGLSEEIAEWQEKWRAFYVKALPLTIELIKEQFPFDLQYPGDATEEQHKKNRTTWNNTVKARAFDICGGFLPAGSTTNVGFFGTFDTLNDHFGEMLYHPCQEMRDIAIEVLTKMKEQYPYGTYGLDELYKRYDYVTPEHFYPEGWTTSIKEEDNEVILVGDVNHLVARPTYFDQFSLGRKKGQKFDKVSSSRFNLIFKGYLDFRSYRDLHRHRAGVIDMYVLHPFNEEMNSFYRDNIPQSLIGELSALEKSFKAWWNEAFEADNDLMPELQYAIPMGYNMRVTYKCDLNQAIYILELRTGKTVHNTLRGLMQMWAKSFIAATNETITIHVDWDKDNFTLKRGTQTIAVEPETPTPTDLH